MASVKFPPRDSGSISSNASLAIQPRLPSPASFQTASIGTDQPDPKTASAVGAEVIATFDVPGNWSGKGQHIEFARDEAIPLKEGAFLGRGAFADVHEVICRGTRIARKQIHCPRRIKIEDVKRELDILKKLSHKHVVTLIGSYTQGKVLGLLLYPVAACDLGMFLDELDEEQRKDSTEVEVGEGLWKLMIRLGLPPTTNHARERLNKVYGCLASAVQYLHGNDIRHKDLKPRNILLDRNNGLYVTDFGLSRDTSDASSSVTDGIERGTYKYCAPEVAKYLPRGRAADIFTLGCVFLELTSVCRGLSLIEFDEFRNEGGDHSFQNNPKQLKDWMSKLRKTKIHSLNTHSGMFDIVDVTDKMVSPVPADRPIIGSVCSSLYLLDEPAYFGDCCTRRRYQELVEDHKSLELELDEMKTLLNHVEEDHRLKRAHLLEEIDLLSAELWDRKRQIDTRHAAHQSEKAKIVENHRRQLLEMKRQYEDKLVKQRASLTSIINGHKTEIQDIYHRHRYELDKARKTRDIENESEQRLGNSRSPVLSTTPPMPANQSRKLRPPVQPPIPPAEAKAKQRSAIPRLHRRPATRRSASRARKTKKTAIPALDEQIPDEGSVSLKGSISILSALWPESRALREVQFYELWKHHRNA